MRADSVHPGDLLVVIEGRRQRRVTQIGEPIWDDDDDEDRSALGTVVRVLSIATWPMLLCEVEWQPVQQYEQPKSLYVFHSLYFQAPEQAEQDEKLKKSKKPAPKRRVFLRVTEARLRRVGEDFLKACRGES